MERLTFDGNFCDIAQCRENPCPYNGSCTQRKVWERLKAYEQTGFSPGACEIAAKAEAALSSIGWTVDRAAELLKADKEGRVVVLPCKVGDTLFRVFAGEILEHKVRNMRYLAIQGRWDIDMTPFFPYAEKFIGKTVFLTREEAESALEATKDGNG